MAILYKVNGEKIEVSPQDGKKFTLAELYAMLDCNTVEVVFLRDGKIMIVDKDGKLTGRQANPWATRIFHTSKRMNIYDYIAGPALVCQLSEF